MVLMFTSTVVVSGMYVLVARFSCFPFYTITAAVRQVCNSTGQKTPAIYQSNHCTNATHASHLPIISPRWATSLRIHSTSYTYTNIKNRTAHCSSCDDGRSISTYDRTNTRSTRFVLGKPSEYRRLPRSYHVDPLPRRREVAHGVLSMLFAQT